MRARCGDEKGGKGEKGGRGVSCVLVVSGMQELASKQFMHAFIQSKHLTLAAAANGRCVCMLRAFPYRARKLIIVAPSPLDIAPVEPDT